MTPEALAAGRSEAPRTTQAPVQNSYAWSVEKAEFVFRAIEISLLFASILISAGALFAAIASADLSREAAKDADAASRKTIAVAERLADQAERSAALSEKTTERLRHYAEAFVQPSLMFRRDGGVLSVGNNGLGPASIRSYVFSLSDNGVVDILYLHPGIDGDSAYDRLGDFLSRHKNNLSSHLKSSEGFAFSREIIFGLLRTDADFELIILRSPSSNYQQLLNAIQSIGLKVCYCNVFSGACTVNASGDFTTAEGGQGAEALAAFHKDCAQRHDWLALPENLR